MVTKTFRATKPRKDILKENKTMLISQLKHLGDQLTAMDLDGDEHGWSGFDSVAYCTAAGGESVVVSKHVLENGVDQYDEFINAYNGVNSSVELLKGDIEAIIGTDRFNPLKDYISFRVTGNGPLVCEGGTGFEDPELIDYSSCFLRGLIAKHGNVMYRFTVAHDTVHGTDTVVVLAGNSPERYDFSNEHP